MPLLALILCAVLAWQIELSVECAQRCIHPPRPAARAAATPRPPASQACKDSQCQIPQPPQPRVIVPPSPRH
jgi:hypothetical protein